MNIRTVTIDFDVRTDTTHANAAAMLAEANLTLKVRSYDRGAVEVLDARPFEPAARHEVPNASEPLAVDEPLLRAITERSLVLDAASVVAMGREILRLVEENRALKGERDGWVAVVRRQEVDMRADAKEDADNRARIAALEAENARLKLQEDKARDAERDEVLLFLRNLAQEVFSDGDSRTADFVDGIRAAIEEGEHRHPAAQRERPFAELNRVAGELMDIADAPLFDKADGDS
jgi:hypothetical protein